MTGEYLLPLAYLSLALTLHFYLDFSRRVGKPWDSLPIELKQKFGREYPRKMSLPIPIAFFSPLLGMILSKGNDLLLLSFSIGLASASYLLSGTLRLSTLLYPIGLSLGVVSLVLKLELPRAPLNPSLVLYTILGVFLLLLIKYRHFLTFNEEKLLSFLEKEKERRRYKLLVFLLVTTFWILATLKSWEYTHN